MSYVFKIIFSLERNKEYDKDWYYLLSFTSRQQKKGHLI
jgi:hypothetical protein